jgi:hypothetical protein
MQQEHEADHLLPSSAAVNGGAILLQPHTLNGMVLKYAIVQLEGVGELKKSTSL